MPVFIAFAAKFGICVVYNSMIWKVTTQGTFLYVNLIALEIPHVSFL